jgi:hypothetical protein
VTARVVHPPRFVYRAIRLEEPQLLVDDYLIDNRFTEDLLSARVAHVLHPPRRSAQPVLAPDAAHPWELGGICWASVVYDAPARRFRMYYQVYQRFVDRARYPAESRPPGAGYPPGKYVIGYAESTDGLVWERPALDLVPWGPYRATNILLQGQREAFSPHVHIHPAMAGGPANAAPRTLGLLPPDAFRGHRFLLFYGDGEHYLATSEDGIHWQERQQCLLRQRVDAFLTLVYAEEAGEYVCYLRNTKVFKPRGGRLANVRMVARLASPQLWTEWDTDGLPSTVLLPATGDADRFYLMPVFRYGGVYWGFLSPLYEDPARESLALSASRDTGEWGGAGGAAGRIDLELAYSRDGVTWHRLPGHPKLLPGGESGAWDSGMLFGPDRVIEHGDEWWLYYNGWNGPHYARPGPGPAERLGAIGLARCRKEGFVSIRADPRGKRSYVVTRPLLWPGGDLFLNVDASRGAVAVRVTDVLWDELAGFGYEQSERFTGNAVRHRIRWGPRSLEELAGRYIRLEFELVQADLFAFVASRAGG